MANKLRKKVDQIVDEKLSEFSLFGNVGEKSAKALIDEADIAVRIWISPKAEKCEKISDDKRKVACQRKIMAEAILMLVNEIDKRIDRCGADRKCIDYLLQVLISYARFSREQLGQNIDDVVTKIVQRYGYTGITWADQPSSKVKIPSFIQDLS
jgi:hypothetical protein